jgi:hypothetical protein
VLKAGTLRDITDDLFSCAGLRQQPQALTRLKRTQPLDCFVKNDSEATDGPSSGVPIVEDPTPRELELLSLLEQAQAEIAQLRVALESNRTIGAACGILMAQLQVSQEEAFSRLRTASQASGRKLSVMATDVLLTGTLTSPT